MHLSAPQLLTLGAARGRGQTLRVIYRLVENSPSQSPQNERISHLTSQERLSPFSGWPKEPNRNRKPEPSEPFFPKPKAELEPPEPFSRNRNRNRNRPFLLNSTDNKEKLVSQGNRRNRKPEPLEPFHPRTVTEPNRTEASLLFRERKTSPKFFRRKCCHGCPHSMLVSRCLFFQDLEGLTEVFGRMSAGMSGPKASSLG